MSNWENIYGWEEVKEYLFPKILLCEGCGMRRPEELHHILIHRAKGNKKLDCAINAMALCKECHESGKYNSWKEREKHYNKQVERYGEEAVLEWLDSLQLRDKPKFGGQDARKAG